MKKSPIFIFCSFLILALILIIYFSSFDNRLSQSSDDWGNFGGYLAGTAGVLFSLFSFILIYYTFFEQRKNSFENTFHQLVINYSSLISLINERWLHTDSDKVGNPVYRKGREIFGNVIDYVKDDDSEEKFLKIFYKHINVFQHYINYLIEVIDTIKQNEDLKDKKKISYYKRFSSQLSFCELMFIAFYTIKLQPEGETKKILSKYFLSRLTEMTKSQYLPQKQQLDYIINKINH
jgi:hypothetical protein